MLKHLIPFIAFVVLANPVTFKAVRGVAGNWVASADGTATLAGLILHALVFILVVGFLMRQARRSGYTLETREDAKDAENKHFQENRIVYAVTN